LRTVSSLPGAGSPLSYIPSSLQLGCVGAATGAAATAAAAAKVGSRTAERCAADVRFCRYRFKFQSNLVWDSIKPISNFCFQF
jgi:hypothetical protein